MIRIRNIEIAITIKIDHFEARAPEIPNHCATGREHDLCGGEVFCTIIFQKIDRGLTAIVGIYFAATDNVDIAVAVEIDRLGMPASKGRMGREILTAVVFIPDPVGDNVEVPILIEINRVNPIGFIGGVDVLCKRERPPHVLQPCPVGHNIGIAIAVKVSDTDRLIGITTERNAIGIETGGGIARIEFQRGCQNIQIAIAIKIGHDDFIDHVAAIELMRGKDLGSVVFIPGNSDGITRERYQILVAILIQIDRKHIERGSRGRIGGRNADAAAEYSRTRDERVANVDRACDRIGRVAGGV